MDTVFNVGLGVYSCYIIFVGSSWLSGSRLPCSNVGSTVGMYIIYMLRYKSITVQNSTQCR